MAPHRVLIVEPQLPVRHAVAEYLRQCGYKVYEAFNTDEALVLLSKTDVTVDVVVADISSHAAVDGFGLSQWIKAERPRTRVLLASSLQKVTEYAGNLCDEGLKLSRPYHPQTLHEEIKRQLAAK